MNTINGRTIRDELKHNFKFKFAIVLLGSIDLYKTFRRRFNLNFVYRHHSKLTKGYSSKNHLSKSCTALHSYDDGVEITSSEDNTIRIQIKYDDSVPTSALPFTKLPTNVCYENAGITRVSTDFSDNFRFNEKPIDVPEEFERNARLRVREQSKAHGRKKVATSVRQLNPLEEFLQVSFWKLTMTNNL